MHIAEKEMLFRALTPKVPKFNRVVFDSSADSKQEVGTINEILGPFNKYVSCVDSRCSPLYPAQVSTPPSSPRNRKYTVIKMTFFL